MEAVVVRAGAAVVERVRPRIEGRTRSYFVEEERQSDLFKPRRIPGTDLYLETNFSANDCVRKTEQVLENYGYDRAELEIFTEEA